MGQSWLLVWIARTGSLIDLHQATQSLPLSRMSTNWASRQAYQKCVHIGALFVGWFHLARTSNELHQATQKPYRHIQGVWCRVQDGQLCRFCFSLMKIRTVWSNITSCFFSCCFHMLCPHYYIHTTLNHIISVCICTWRDIHSVCGQQCRQVHIASSPGHSQILSCSRGEKLVR